MAEDKVTLNIKLETSGFIIYHTEKELYSNGSPRPLFGRKPKVWNTIGNLKNHLLSVLLRGPEYSTFPGSGTTETKRFFIANTYRNCVAYDIAKNEVVDFDFYEYVEDHFNKDYYGKNGYTIVYI